MTEVDDGIEDQWLWKVGKFHVRTSHLPLLIGAVTVLLLLSLSVTVFCIWRCCCSPRSRRAGGGKCTDGAGDKTTTVVNNHPRVFRSHSAGIGSSRYQTPGEYSQHVVEVIPHQEPPVSWLYDNHKLTLRSESPDGPVYPSRFGSHHHQDGENDHYRDCQCYGTGTIWSTPSSMVDCSLPEISEFSTNPCPYLSNNLLEECHRPPDDMDLKTRSLPSCVRHKKRLSSTVDYSTDIYEKVNFSKKKKNRMHNDEAAAIALSRSRSQFFPSDKDILVDNEAVIVYDERTAL